MEMLWFGGIFAFVAAAICGCFMVPFLRKLKFGQKIRNEGPKWHGKKSGTPTMGGFIFLIAILVALFAATAVFNIKLLVHVRLLILLVITFAYASIGFIDDYIKVVKKRNLGLTSSQKFALQLLVATLFVFYVNYNYVVSTTISIPFSNLQVDLGGLYLPFAVIVILATVNSVNLTDGLDGLATCVTLVVAAFYLFFSIRVESTIVALFAATVIGGLLGFLIYNHYPAKVFMGDTGSLALGGAICGMAILLEQPLTLLIVGFVYVMESLSVILQVASYKLTRKRIFKMSPIHHHFEMCGWKEWVIVVVFTLVTVLVCGWMYYYG